MTTVNIDGTCTMCGDYARDCPCGVFRILVGDGHGEHMTDVKFLPVTFTDEESAIEYVWEVYDNDTTDNPNWQSRWAYVTDADTIEQALMEWDMQA